MDGSDPEFDSCFEFKYYYWRSIILVLQNRSMTSLSNLCSRYLLRSGLGRVFALVRLDLNLDEHFLNNQISNCSFLGV